MFGVQVYVGVSKTVCLSLNPYLRLDKGFNDLLHRGLVFLLSGTDLEIAHK